MKKLLLPIAAVALLSALILHRSEPARAATPAASRVAPRPEGRKREEMRPRHAPRASARRALLTTERARLQARWRAAEC